MSIQQVTSLSIQDMPRDIIYEISRHLSKTEKFGCLGFLCKELRSRTLSLVDLKIIGLKKIFEKIDVFQPTLNYKIEISPFYRQEYQFLNDSIKVIYRAQAKLGAFQCAKSSILFLREGQDEAFTELASMQVKKKDVEGAVRTLVEEKVDPLNSARVQAMFDITVAIMKTLCRVSKNGYGAKALVLCEIAKTQLLENDMLGFQQTVQSISIKKVKDYKVQKQIIKNFEEFAILQIQNSDHRGAIKTISLIENFLERFDAFKVIIKYLLAKQYNELAKQLLLNQKKSMRPDGLDDVKFLQEIAKFQAQAMDFDGAIETAESLKWVTWFPNAKAYCKIAKVLAKSHPEEAKKIINKFKDIFENNGDVKYLYKLFKVQVLTKDIDEALKNLKKIGENQANIKYVKLTRYKDEIIKILVENGEIDKAIETVSNYAFKMSYQQILKAQVQMNDIVGAKSLVKKYIRENGEATLARMLLERVDEILEDQSSSNIDLNPSKQYLKLAKKICAKTKGRLSKGRLFSSIAEKQIQIGDRKNAKKTLKEAKSFVWLSSRTPYFKDFVYESIALGFIKLNAIVEVKKIIKFIVDKRYTHRIFTEIAEMQLKHYQLDKAKGTIEKLKLIITNPVVDNSYNLEIISLLQMKAGELEAAWETALQIPKNVYFLSAVKQLIELI